MPDIIVRNETPDNLNVAFRFVAPANWTNTLKPGDSWNTHLPSTPFTVEVRIDNTDNRFSADKSWATAGDITGGWFAGAASVVLGAASLRGGVVGGSAFAGASVALMQHAISAGARFAQNAEGMVITIGGVWIPFNNKIYVIRFDEWSGYSLWDVDRNVKL